MLGALHKDHAVVALQHAGVCSTCGLGTYMACPTCRTAHYCSSVCRREQSVDHAKECGKLHCKPVPLPAGDLLHSVVNMRLRTDGEEQRPQITLDPHELQARPSRGKGPAERETHQ